SSDQRTGQAISSATPSLTAGPSASPTPEHRPIVTPRRLLVENEAFGRSKGRVARAIADLKKVDLWKPLTRRLYAVKFGSRTGKVNIPDDGHLADAYLTARVDGDVGGAFCDIMFFPSAMIADLERWRTYYSQGLIAEAPPSARQFWASIMAHELAHCLKGKNGEPVAMAWEERALAAVRQAGLR
ncbi:MAG: hypothetical protein ACLGHL_09955, partial [Actinomycetota bacterium]